MEISPVESALKHAARLRQRDGGHDGGNGCFSRLCERVEIAVWGHNPSTSAKGFVTKSFALYFIAL